MFVDWIEAEYSLHIYNNTAHTWLTKLGFSQVHHQKGVYFDGHDRDDVVAYRNFFLEKISVINMVQQHTRTC